MNKQNIYKTVYLNKLPFNKFLSRATSKSTAIMMICCCLCLHFCLVAKALPADSAALDKISQVAPLLTDTRGRQQSATSLNGQWNYIVDPYETGFFDYRYKELAPDNPSAYWNNPHPTSKTDLVEFGWDPKYSLEVPGDWNHQKKQFLYYEGTLWYEKSFDFQKKLNSSRVFLYFGAINYRADVYLNGHNPSCALTF